MWRGGIIWQSLQWAVRGFLVPKWSRFWSTWEKTGFDLLALVHRMPATILEQLKTYGKPQSLPQGTHNTHIIITRMEQSQPEKHSAFIWVFNNLVPAARAGLGVTMVWWPSNHHTQCSLVGPHCNTASPELGVSQGNESDVNMKQFRKPQKPMGNLSPLKRW